MKVGTRIWNLEHCKEAISWKHLELAKGYGIFLLRPWYQSRGFQAMIQKSAQNLELKAQLALQGGNKLKIFGACKRICLIFVATMIQVTRISSDDMKVGTRLMGHFWALFERKCENEGRKTQSQARIMGYGVFREPTLWQHRRCPLWAEKSKSYSKSCKIICIFGWN